MESEEIVPWLPLDVAPVPVDVVLLSFVDVVRSEGELVMDDSLVVAMEESLEVALSLDRVDSGGAPVDGALVLVGCELRADEKMEALGREELPPGRPTAEASVV